MACGKRGCFGQDVDVGGVRVEELLLITLSASDPDGDDLTFDATLPPGGVLTDNVLTWSPSAEQVGSFIVTITVTDGSGGSSSAIGAKSGQSISCGYIDRPDPLEMSNDGVLHQRRAPIAIGPARRDAVASARHAPQVKGIVYVIRRPR